MHKLNFRMGCSNCKKTDGMSHLILINENYTDPLNFHALEQIIDDFISDERCKLCGDNQWEILEVMIDDYPVE